ncbi:MAG: PTS transporter subunit EIIB [Actinomycetaceae bacterium]|nr:PTS transporter subunit EIIB [Actinomycetaceae bacterium]
MWLTKEEGKLEAARQLVRGLGGADNIGELEPCMMRIRATCKDPTQVDEGIIRQTKPLAVVRSGNYVQIIVRFNATDMVEKMRTVIKSSNSGNGQDDDDSEDSGGESDTQE